ncbi:hypothetical protein K449DRAFT_428616 [Hypoxylon sp. EC38]|nr:hypothetical protein K449DRAFT_428616 [Hypoxylon sp. EC38]
MSSLLRDFGTLLKAKSRTDWQEELSIFHQCIFIPLLCVNSMIAYYHVFVAQLYNLKNSSHLPTYNIDPAQPTTLHALLLVAQLHPFSAQQPGICEAEQEGVNPGSQSRFTVKFLSSKQNFTYPAIVQTY